MVFEGLSEDEDDMELENGGDDEAFDDDDA